VGTGGEAQQVGYFAAVRPADIAADRHAKALKLQQSRRVLLDRFGQALIGPTQVGNVGRHGFAGRLTCGKRLQRHAHRIDFPYFVLGDLPDHQSTARDTRGKAFGFEA